MRRIKALGQEAGFTIVEVMVAAVVLIMGVLSVAAVIDAANATTVKTRARVTGTNVARELVEAARGVRYESISDSSIAAEIQAADPALADSPPGGAYTLERRGFVYAIQTETCIMDDGRDGGGTAPRTGDFCADSVAAGSLDSNGRTDRVPEDYKRVTVRATWTLRGRETTITQTTLVNNPGSASAPAVLMLGSNQLAGATMLMSGSSLTFEVATSSQPTTLKWQLDGAENGTICGAGTTACSGRNYTFTWDLQNPLAGDGPYVVSAEAYDRNSVAGATRSMTVVLNRFRPQAPSGFTGGHNNNGNVIDFEWNANPERDLTGYMVYRVATSGGETAVCSLTMRTSCQDPSPLGDNSVRYRIYAFDVDSTGVTPRQSNNFTDYVVSTGNVRPQRPDAPTKTVNADGTVTIAWRMPSPQDPDAGDSIASFRIYRDGTNVSNRFGRVYADGSTTYSFVDDSRDGLVHRYWVTSVDTRLGESGFEEAQAR